jgi:hypothetical protein
MPILDLALRLNSFAFRTLAFANREAEGRHSHTAMDTSSAKAASISHIANYQA